MGERDDVFLKDYVDAEYRGKPLRFHALNIKDTMEFLQFITSGETMFFDEEKMLYFISKSLKVDVKDVRKTPGFLIFAIEQVMEAIDFPFLLKHSYNLLEKVREIASQLEISLPEQSQELPGNSTSPQTKSSQPSP